MIGNGKLQNTVTRAYTPTFDKEPFFLVKNYKSLKVTVNIRNRKRYKRNINKMNTNWNKIH